MSNDFFPSVILIYHFLQLQKIYKKKNINKYCDCKKSRRIENE